MALSVIDLYRDILPRTNCGDCGYPTCMAFAGMVVSEKLPISNCPHLSADVVGRCRIELDEQYAAGKWLKRDMAADALQWAREKSASMAIEDLPGRIGGRLVKDNDGRPSLELPFFNEVAVIRPEGIFNKDGSPLSRWEQVFLYNHMAQGGSRLPAGNWKSLKEFPNTVSKIVSMKAHVESPLIERFTGRVKALLERAIRIGGTDKTAAFGEADLAVYFQALPRVPVMLMFWDGESDEGFGAEVKLLFDETITEHLDIESIMFLSENLRERLCAGA